MANCLVTKLKSNVINDNLVGLGVIRLKAIELPGTPDDWQQLSITFGVVGECTIHAYGGTFFRRSAGSSTATDTLTLINEEAEIQFNNGTYNVDITNKYGLTKIGPAVNFYKHLLSFNLADLKYSVNMTDIRCQQALLSGDISDISLMSNLAHFNAQNNNTLSGNLSSISGLANIVYFDVVDSNITGDIANIASNTLITTLNIANTSIYGDVASIAGCTALTQLFAERSNISGNISALGNMTGLTLCNLSNTQCSGTLESMLDGMLSAGRNSGTITFASNNIITYQGTAFGNTKICTFTNGSYTVTDQV